MSAPEGDASDRKRVEAIVVDVRYSDGTTYQTTVTADMYGNAEHEWTYRTLLGLSYAIEGQ